MNGSLEWTKYFNYLTASLTFNSSSTKKDISLIHERLPEEMLAIIFSFLNSYQLNQAQSVCKKWKKIASTPFLWQALLPPQLQGVEKTKNAKSVYKTNYSVDQNFSSYRPYPLSSYDGITTCLSSRHGKVFLGSSTGCLTIYEANDMQAAFGFQLAQKGRLTAIEATSDDLYATAEQIITLGADSKKTVTILYHWKIHGFKALSSCQPTPPSALFALSHSCRWLSIQDNSPYLYMLEKKSANSFLTIYHRKKAVLINCSVNAFCFHRNKAYLCESATPKKLTVIDLDAFNGQLDKGRSEKSEPLSTQLDELARESYPFQAIIHKVLLLHVSNDHLVVVYQQNGGGYFVAYHSLDNPKLFSSISQKETPSYSLGFRPNDSSIEAHAYCLNRFFFIDKRLTIVKPTTKKPLVIQQPIFLQNFPTLPKPNYAFDFAARKFFMMELRDKQNKTEASTVYCYDKRAKSRLWRLISKTSLTGTGSFFHYLTYLHKTTYKIIRLIGIMMIAKQIVSKQTMTFYLLTMLASCQNASKSDLSLKKNVKKINSLASLALAGIALPFTFALPQAPFYQFINTVFQRFQQWRLETIQKKYEEEKRQASELIPYASKFKLHCPLSHSPIRFPVKFEGVLYERFSLARLLAYTGQLNRLPDMQFQFDLHQKIEAIVEQIKQEKL